MGLRARHLRLPRLRRSIAGVGTAAAAVALTATLAPGAALADPQGPVASSVAPQGTAVDVMTRNLYLGTDHTPLVAALLAPEAVRDTALWAAATKAWQDVQKSDPAARMAAVADEIAAARPAVVGLQEVTTWFTYDYDAPTGMSTNETEAYDFLDLLIEALEARGVLYHEVAGATAYNFTAPWPVAVGDKTTSVNFQDRDVILRRDDVATSDPRKGHFAPFQLSFAVTGYGMVTVTRGWGSVDVTTRRSSFRFVNAHTEAGRAYEGLRVLQVQKLLATQQAIAETDPLPIVYVGDYNSKAGLGDAYNTLVSSVGTDVWSATNPGEPGYTCCYDSLNDADAVLDERLDLVVVGPGVIPASTKLVGEEDRDMTESVLSTTGLLWPSDHAGVVARLVMPKPTS